MWVPQPDRFRDFNPEVIMKIIAIFTTTRADFGLLSSLIDQIEHQESLGYILFVGGSHYLASQGDSLIEIHAKGYKYTSFDFLSEDDSEQTLADSLAYEATLLSGLFTETTFDLVCVLGDRVELLPIVSSAIIFRKPIIHIHGGEITEGAIDNQIRHMITKSAHLHFTACSEYRQNIIRMGEEAWRVHNVGALGVDTIINKQTQGNIFIQLSLNTQKPIILMTYHPVTLEDQISSETQIKNLFKALQQFDFQVIITAPNVDPSHSCIFDVIMNNVELNSDYHFIRTLGIDRYQALLNYVEFVIGNSSSGILEAPFFKIPTVNIGDRQKGRIRHVSVIDTDYTTGSILEGIKKAIDPAFRKNIQKMDYLFGDGKAAERITEIIRETEINQKLLRKKLEFTI